MIWGSWRTRQLPRFGSGIESFFDASRQQPLDPICFGAALPTKFRRKLTAAFREKAENCLTG
jgi:hypothetical protein